MENSGEGPEVVKDFRRDDYMGTWYEAFRTDGMRFEKGECVAANYSVHDDTYIKVINSLQEWKDGQGGEVKDEHGGVEGWAIQKNPAANDGHLGVKFSPLQPVWGSYDILDTDYTSYAYVYGKSDGILGFMKFEYVWVLTRKPILQGTVEQQQVRDRAKEFLERAVPGWSWDTMRPCLQSTDVANYRQRFS